MRALTDYLSKVSRRDLWFALASVAVTSLVMTGFLLESRWGYMWPGPQVIYFQNWSDKRTIGEIKRDQAIALAEQVKRIEEARAAEKAALEKAAREQDAKAGAVPQGAQPAGQPTRS